MKKIMKKAVLVAVSLLLVVVSIVSSSAATIYILDGYSYSVTDNLSITLEDWDTSIDSILTLPDELAKRYFTNIANWAFESRTDLKGLDLSNAVHLQTIGYESFIDCTEIANDLVIPESVVNILDRAFSGCSSITSITINGKVTMIPVECFYNCDSARTVVLPDTLQSIGSWAFGSCDSLEYAEIPKSVTSIASSAFKNDPNLLLGVYKDTAGHQYAVNNRIDHIVLDGETLGDVNGDGIVDVFDATEIQKYAAEKMDLTPEQFELGDINKDGFVDVMDALLVQKSLVGMYDIPQNIIRY